MPDEVIEDYDPSVPIAPRDVVAAGRGCQAIVLIFVAIGLIICLAIFVAIFN